MLLGTAFAAVAISLPARAATQSWQDTALSATAVTDETFGGTNLKFTNDKGVIDLSGNNVTWSLGSNFSGLSISSTTSGSATISYSGSNTADNSHIHVDATDSNGNAEAFLLQMYLTPGSISFNGSTTLETISDLADTDIDNTVAFSAHNDSGDSQSDVGDFTVSNLPTGLTSDEPLTYAGMTVSDPGGGVSSDTLRDGLILVHCSSGNWQQFIRLSNGALKNWATGLYVNPGGTGAQLRGESSARRGSSYTWRAESSLPA